MLSPSLASAGGTGTTLYVTVLLPKEQCKSGVNDHEHTVIESNPCPFGQKEKGLLIFFSEASQARPCLETTALRG